MNSRSRKAPSPLSKSEQMARVRSKNTSPELRLRRALWSRGLRYSLHQKLPGTPDISFGACKLAIFVDGCFWHGCPVHYTKPATNPEFWSNKVLKNAARDARARAALEELGWTVMRIWEHEIDDDLSAAVKRVAASVAALKAKKARKSGV